MNIAVNNGVNGANSATPESEQVTGTCELHRLAAADVQLVDASPNGCADRCAPDPSDGRPQRGARTARQRRRARVAMHGLTTGMASTEGFSGRRHSSPASAPRPAASTKSGSPARLGFVAAKQPRQSVPTCLKRDRTSQAPGPAAPPARARLGVSSADERRHRPRGSGSPAESRSRPQQ